MDFQPETIIKTIQEFKRKIHNMDDRVKKYLSDRKRYPHPGHEVLIRQVQQFESKVHLIRNTDVQFWLDGLMHTLMVYQRIWRRAFEDEEHVYGKRRGTGRDWSDDIPIDQLYKAAQEKWRQMGVTKEMTKKEMLEKVKPQYEQAKRDLKQGERLAWSINKKNNELNVHIKSDK